LTLFIKPLIMVSLAILMLAGCATKTDPVGPDGSNSNTVRFSVDAAAAESVAYRWAEGSFDSEKNYTVVGFSIQATRPDPSEEIDGLSLLFPGNSVGTFTIAANSASIIIVHKGVSYDGVSGTLKISKYGIVGETIEGSYTGILANQDDTLEVTSFTFSAKRIADNELNMGGDDGSEQTATMTLSGDIGVTGDISIVPTTSSVIVVYASRRGAVEGEFEHNGVTYQVFIDIPVGSVGGAWDAEYPWYEGDNPNLPRFAMSFGPLGGETTVLRGTEGTTTVTSISDTRIRASGSGTCTTQVGGEDVTITIENFEVELDIAP